ncbi:MAG: MFS transporter [Chloroflexi bacterium]|nr:MFS transporter [Chloroflexota bacterium]
MGFRSAVGPLFSTRERRQVLIALTAAYMLIQLASMPVALALPTIAEHFDTSLGDAAWVVIGYLLALGSMVMLAARIGDRYGHARVFFIGLVATTAGSALIGLSNSLFMVIFWRAVTGFGGALILGNFNAILAATYPPEERGRAFSIPIIGSRFATLAGLAMFGVFLTYISWRLVFFSFLPLGIIAIVLSLPMLRQREHSRPVTTARVDLLGGALLVAAAFALVLSGNHLHGGEESFVSGDALRFHLPMHVLFLALVGVLILVERQVKNPLIEMGHFKNKYFSRALVTNVAYHSSMLATTTLIPILIVNGYGMAPVWVIMVLLPNQAIGMVMPFVAGWIYDKYRPKYLRPGAMAMIAGGFVILGIFAGKVPIWALPILMVPMSIGTQMFNPINNATIMNSLALTHRGFASGMMETTRELGHALGATVSAAVLAIALPAAIELLTDEAARPFYVEGFQLAALSVVFILLAGAAIAYFHKEVKHESGPRPASQPSYQPSGGDGDD